MDSSLSVFNVQICSTCRQDVAEPTPNTFVSKILTFIKREKELGFPELDDMVFSLGLGCMSFVTINTPLCFVFTVADEDRFPFPLSDEYV